MKQLNRQLTYTYLNEQTVEVVRINKRKSEYPAPHEIIFDGTHFNHHVGLPLLRTILLLSLLQYSNRTTCQEVFTGILFLKTSDTGNTIRCSNPAITSRMVKTDDTAYRLFECFVLLY